MTQFAHSLEENSPTSIAAERRSPLAFFLLVFALSVPFALLGAMTGIQLIPGVPISALGFVCPVTAASILVYRESGRAGVAKLLRRSFDIERIASKGWYAPILLLMPCVALVTYALMRATGLPHPAPHFPIPVALLLFVAFFVAALGEELGWSGYAIDPMQRRWGALRASILLGVVWASWHIIAMVQAGQSAAWIAWGCLDMVATRVLMVWIYDNTGRSVFAVALYHAIANLSLKSMFPGGSYESERIISVILAMVAAMVALVWGPRSSSSANGR